MKMRFILLAVAALFLATTPPAFSQERHTQHAAAESLQPGDPGYNHDKWHPYYKEVFTASRCKCPKGMCRETIARQARNSSPSGYEIMISGVWCPVPLNAWIPGNNRDIPRELRGQEAHVCTYEAADGQPCPVPSCVIIKGEPM